MMTDHKSEAIARWMGWEKRQEGVWIPPWTFAPCEMIPAYHESLDALVPVMETLAKQGCYVSFERERGDLEVPVEKAWTATVFASGFDCEVIGTYPAEALRDAIYAALVAMGKVTE